MAEFKKLSDVNVIESRKEGLNVLVEDNGEIVKLAADELTPEYADLKDDIEALSEEIESFTKLKKIQMQISGDTVKCDLDANTINEMVRLDTLVIVERMGVNADYSTGVAYSHGYDIISAFDADYNFLKYQYRFNFPGSLPSIIVDVLNNTITTE